MVLTSSSPSHLILRFPCAQKISPTHNNIHTNPAVMGGYGRLMGDSKSKFPLFSRRWARWARWAIVFFKLKIYIDISWHLPYTLYMRVYSARSAHSAQLVETKGKFAIKFAHRFAHETPIFAQRKTATPKTPEDSRNGALHRWYPVVLTQPERKNNA